MYKVIESNKKQSEFINAIQEEQTLICYGLRGALQGLVEQGCNGPCKDALDKLNKHLNKNAHPHIGTMDFILLIVFLCLTVFTIAMIALFTVYGSVPDTLITCVFATLGGECGILGWIKTTKEKKQDRRWQLADMRREKEEAERIAQQTEEP